MYKVGRYTPLTTDEAVGITKEMYRILDDAGITILRVGLKSTDLITEGGEINGHTYHPAFRQLVEGQIAREALEQQLIELIHDVPRLHDAVFSSSSRSFSNMAGHCGVNRKYFREKYPDIRISYVQDPDIGDGRYLVSEKNKR